MADLSLGERIVRKSFNPSEKPEVKEAKILCAALIDFCDTYIPNSTFATAEQAKVFAEEERLLREAMRCFEQGCMWLAKGLTVEQAK